MVIRIYPPKLQLNKANTSDTEAQFFGFAFIYFLIIAYLFTFQMDLFHLKFMISAMTDFDIVDFPFLDGDVPRLSLTGFTFLNLFGLLKCLVM